MLQIKRYLGFTDGIKEPRKTKVENTLDKLYSYKGSVYNSVSFLCTKLLEGCYLEKREDYTTLKRNGERTLPRTLYMFSDKEGNRYFELNKTQYDFVQYLIDNGLDTEEKMIAYDKADVEKIEFAKKAEEESEKHKKELERQHEEEKEKFKEWMFTESMCIPDWQMEIIDSIFMALYGKENTWNYSLAVCINNYDKPMCKEEVMARLHNDNKASIKIFECLTGLKLPKGYKDRMAYLDSITSADFENPVEYKPRKKAEKKEVKKEEFYILMGNYTWNRVMGEPIKKYGIDMFIYCDNGMFKLSHTDTGMCIISGKNKTDCMKKLKRFMDSRGIEEFNKIVETNKKRIAEKAGENPRLKFA